MNKKDRQKLSGFREELAELINRYSLEIFCDLPDFIIADHLVRQFKTLVRTTRLTDQYRKDCQDPVRDPQD